MALAELKKWSTTLYRDASDSDNRQVPAAGVQVNVYRRGATLTDVAFISAGQTVTVPVYSTGSIVAGDQVQVMLNHSAVLNVLSVPDATSLQVKNNTANLIYINPEDRLLVITSRPAMYTDPVGTTLISNGTTWADDRGAVSFYTPVALFDYTVTADAETGPYTDQAGGSIGSPWANVLDYATFQDAINALVAAGGGVLYVPPGRYDSTTSPAVNPMTLNGTSIIFQGAGDGRSWIHHDGTDDLFTVNGPISYLHVQGIFFEGKGVSGGDPGVNHGRGVVLHAVSNSTFRDVRIGEFPREGLWSDGVGGDSVNITFENVLVHDSHNSRHVYFGSNGSGHGVFAYECYGLRTEGNYDVLGMEIHDSDGLRFYNCVWEFVKDQPFLLLSGSYSQLSFRDCWFEHNGIAGVATPTHWLIENAGNGHGIIFDHNHFVRTGADITSLRAYKSTTGILGEGTFLSNNGLITNVPVGTDDYVFTASDIVTFLGYEYVLSSVGPPANTRYQLQSYHPNQDGQVARFGSGWRLKLRALSADEMTNQIKNTTSGDVILDSTGSGYRLKLNIGGYWRTLNIPFMTVAQRNAMTWSHGDQCYTTDGTPHLTFCTVAGTPGTWITIV